MDKNNKYRYWVFTWNATEEPLSKTGFVLPNKSSLKNFLDFYAEDYVFQEEEGEETKRPHLQGAIKTKNRLRHQTLLNFFKESFIPLDGVDLCINLTIDRMRGTWAEAVNYCSKSSTKIGETVSAVNREPYTGSDVSFLESREKRFPWQNSLFDQIFESDQVSIKVPNDREIVWIFDSKGNCGKSKFVKYICSNSSDIVKISFGSAPQLRSAIISCGQKKVYVIDMPRTLAEEDSLPSLISTLEDLKNGFIVSVFYGKYQQLLMEPPHVIVFSNKKCPVNMMSDDRWMTYTINRDDKTLEEIYDYI